MAWVVLLFGLLLVLPCQGYIVDFEDPDKLDIYIDTLFKEYAKRKKDNEKETNGQDSNFLSEGFGQKTSPVDKQETAEDLSYEGSVKPQNEQEIFVEKPAPKGEILNEANFAENDPKTNDENSQDTTTVAETPKNETAESPLEPQAHRSSKTMQTFNKQDVFFIFIVAACSVAGFVGLILAGVCWYKLHNNVKAASDVDYPAYGVTGPTKDRLPSPGDRKLAQSAQMYHYQHQKQQMIALEKANGEMKPDASEDESGDENEEGDYTVYECPGLAPTGEMEIRNPLFNEELQRPGNGQTPTMNGHPEEQKRE